MSGVDEAAVEVEDEQECGYVYDHDAETVYEDDEVVQWICHRCGAEGREDLTEDPATPTDHQSQPAGGGSEESK